MENKIKKYKVKGGQLIHPRKCRVCGCTWFHACPGGCYWVEPDLCSRCADQLDLQPSEQLPGRTMSMNEILAGIDKAKIKIIDPDREFQLISQITMNPGLIYMGEVPGEEAKAVIEAIMSIT